MGFKAFSRSSDFRFPQCYPAVRLRILLSFLPACLLPRAVPSTRSSKDVEVGVPPVQQSDQSLSIAEAANKWPNAAFNSCSIQPLLSALAWAIPALQLERRSWCLPSPDWLASTICHQVHLSLMPLTAKSTMKMLTPPYPKHDSQQMSQPSAPNLM